MRKSSFEVGRNINKVDGWLNIVDEKLPKLNLFDDCHQFCLKPGFVPVEQCVVINTGWKIGCGYFKGSIWSLNAELFQGLPQNIVY